MVAIVSVSSGCSLFKDSSCDCPTWSQTDEKQPAAVHTERPQAADGLNGS